MADAIKLKFTADGKDVISTMKMVDAIMARHSRQIVQRAIETEMSVNALAAKSRAAFVAEHNTWKTKLDPEKSRASDVESASRNIKARKIRRARIEDRAAKIQDEEDRKQQWREQVLADTQQVRASETAGQVEIASRNRKAAALRRARKEEREKNAADYLAERTQVVSAKLEQKRLISTYARESAAGYMGPMSLTAQEQYDAQQMMASRANRAAALRAYRKSQPPGHRGGFGGAASAMYLSVARDTSASLASGANPVTVSMQQIPQVLQAVAMAGLKSVGQFLLKAGTLLAHPFTIIAAAAVAAKFAMDSLYKANQQTFKSGAAASVANISAGDSAVEQMQRNADRGLIPQAEVDNLKKRISGKPEWLQKIFIEKAVARQRKLHALDPYKENEEWMGKMTDDLGVDVIKDEKKAAIKKLANERKARDKEIKDKMASNAQLSRERMRAVDTQAEKEAEQAAGKRFEAAGNNALRLSGLAYASGVEKLNENSDGQRSLTDRERIGAGITGTAAGAVQVQSFHATVRSEKHLETIKSDIAEMKSIFQGHGASGSW